MDILNHTKPNQQKINTLYLNINILNGENVKKKCTNKTFKKREREKNVEHTHTEQLNIYFYICCKWNKTDQFKINRAIGALPVQIGLSLIFFFFFLHIKNGELADGVRSESN